MLYFKVSKESKCHRRQTRTGCVTKGEAITSFPRGRFGRAFERELKMTAVQTLELRSSAIRSRLNQINGLEGDAYTDEIRAESDTY